ncbi:SusD/RagB family nutrient-binding outer membrane lipoprotein [Pedobacter sp. MC2016-15]|uniref:SusD/RagB family nutrient-binding outer membrane lipoprotein n=1 Tax=Pedobacter sp. MC2016-15 TaxID=2994473 RepID=UPI0022478FC7|nr:SusD/RagB family nutrient-binding outer membrane lipoprotein [Pedobacter sp. MC2016-15]MCX2481085.1 SusD/RagB family nutrient-binding outer membrane lipoprotein [Pedobacter sp. MC2016-15]
MKKIFANIFLLLFIAATFSACKKTLEEQYNNPEQSSVQSIPTFFTALLNNDRVRPAYWNVRTFLLRQTAVYSQTASFANGNDVYKQDDSYINQYWSDFYFNAGNGSGPMALYRQMEVTYKNLSEADQASQKVFMEAARIQLIDQAAQLVDMWGDIPFSETGSLETSSSIVNPNYDDQKALYASFISQLNDAATFFSTATTNASFTKQDILLAGSTDKWRRYANSLRLRLLMRTSFVDEATSRTAVTAMLANSTQYPLLDGGNVAAYSPATSDVLLTPLTTNNDNLNSALTEISSFYATDYLLNKVLLPANDPRIPVMYDKYGKVVNNVFVQNKTFRAMPVTYTTGQTDTAFTSYSIVDSATFLQNKNLPGIVFTASETNFLKAEAFERWGGGNAQTAYETAVKQSVYFYHYLHSLGRGTTVTPTDVTTFLTAPSIAYAGSSTEKLAKIYIQKWASFSFLQSKQAWAEYRRTKYPVLTFPTAGKLNGFETPPARLLYPNSEILNNSNYSKVRAKDTRLTKIFWDVK